MKRDTRVRLELALLGGLALSLAVVGCVPLESNREPGLLEGMPSTLAPLANERPAPAGPPVPGGGAEAGSVRQAGYGPSDGATQPGQEPPALPSGEPTAAPELPVPRQERTRSEDGKLTLHFDEADVRKALELLSREGKLNILISPGVNGPVTAHLRGVTADQALDAIARLANLVIRRAGDLIYVYTPDELARGLGAEQWFATRIYRLNYARSIDVLSMVRPLLSERGRITASPSGAGGISGNVSGGGGLPAGGGSPPAGVFGTPSGSGGAGGAGGSPGGGTPSGGGGLGSSSGGNQLAGGEVLVVQDQISVLREVDRIVTELDVPPMQVEIEAVIMSIEHDKDQEFSVNFAVVDNGRRLLETIGNGSLINAAAGFLPSHPVTSAGALMGTAAAGSAANDQAAKFAYSSNNLTYFIRALETTGKVDVLARPKILVLNKQQAYILLGQQLGYSTLSQNLVSTTQQVQYLNVGTQLRVRPYISSDGMVRMEVHPERSTGVFDANNIPQVTTSEVTTNVLVPDGATLVIGGLIDQVDSRQQSGTPYLADLPGIGALFRSRVRTGSRRELVVLMTPRIWNPHGPPAAPYLSPPGFLPADAGKIFPVAPNLPDLDPLARPLAAPIRFTPNPPTTVGVGRSAVSAAPPAAPGAGPPTLGMGLEVEVHSPTAALPMGKDLIYEIHVRNRSEQAAAGVVLSANASAGLELVEADGPTPGYRSGGQSMSYRPLEQLPPRAELVYRVKAHAGQLGPQSLRATLQSPGQAGPVSGEARVNVTDEKPSP